jgi:hypothetical protein
MRALSPGVGGNIYPPPKALFRAGIHPARSVEAHRARAGTGSPGPCAKRSSALAAGGTTA